MILPLEKEKRYTYSDYLQWDDEVRYEIIDGVPYAMGSPSSTHQRISRKLTKHIDTFLDGKPCELFYAPYDVRLNFDTFDDIVVQPDLLVVCDKSKIDKNSYNGVPDLIIEIVSPSTASMDRVRKYHLYRRAKVKEYWIIDPDNKTVSFYTLKDDEYVSDAFGENDKLTSKVLEGFVVDLTEVFGVMVENEATDK
ncbi:MAG: Uma2 family endonuclease [Candidatus Cloacimonetes bacterium]|nr:Uma2 family endonuclease [Candidatus Cloacimonadota bacterium]